MKELIINMDNVCKELHELCDMTVMAILDDKSSYRDFTFPRNQQSRIYSALQTLRQFAKTKS